MNSSTSSFKSELKVITVVVLVLVAGEIFIRATLGTSSSSIRRIRAIPTRTKQMHQAQSPKIVVIGNSLAIYGLNEKVFLEEMRDHDQNVYLQVEAFKGSQIGEWYYLFKRFFLNTGMTPDFLILPINLRSVRDNDNLSMEWLVDFCAWKDIPELFTCDLSSFGDRAEFLHAYTCASFAYREKIRVTILEKLIPHFRKGERVIHGSTLRKEDARRGKATYKKLKNLMELARQNDIHVICVFMPSLIQSDIDEILVQTVEQEGMDFINLHKLEGMGKEHFSDSFHLNDKGAKIVTQVLVQRLLEKKY